MSFLAHSVEKFLMQKQIKNARSLESSFCRKQNVQPYRHIKLLYGYVMFWSTILLLSVIHMCTYAHTSSQTHIDTDNVPYIVAISQQQ